jgi:single-strand DNA-binding protein
MASYNRTILMGNITADPDIRRVGEKDVCKFSVAVNNPFREGKVLFMDCEYWKGGAVVNYLNKGTSVLVEGELDQQVWERDGQKRSKVVLNVNAIQLVGGKKDTAREEEFVSEFR